jgi:hypothetical protein
MVVVHIYPLAFSLIVTVDKAKHVKLGMRIGHQHTYMYV